MPELEAIIARLEPELGPLEGEPKPLDGGITNRNFRLRLGGEDLVLASIAPPRRSRRVARRRRRSRRRSSPSSALGNEPVRVGGEVVGRVTSGGYGYTVERSIAYAYLPPEHDVGTAVEVDIFGRWIAGEVAREPLYDPDGEHVRG
jgi:hypothetical protein